MYVGSTTPSSATACYTPLHETTPLPPREPIPIRRPIYTTAPIVATTLDDRKIHHHVTPSTNQHSIIPLGVPKFRSWISPLLRRGPMLIEMTRLSHGTLGISISLQIKIDSLQIGDMFMTRLH